jgi:hypothetical protein
MVILDRDEATMLFSKLQSNRSTFVEFMVDWETCDLPSHNEQHHERTTL